MQAILSSPFFGVVLSIFSFEAGVIINRKTKSPLANPLLLAMIFVILFLKLFRIPLSDFQKGGDLISLFLAPATASLALSIYRQYDVLKKNLIPILAGCAAGSVMSMGSIMLMCRMFRLDEKLTYALLPKSVTTPIAIEISAQHGGLVPFTVAAVVITGVAGAVSAPYLIKLFRVKDPISAGIAIGACSHALGTSRALEIGEVEGAMSSIAIGVSGLFTVLLSMFL